MESHGVPGRVQVTERVARAAWARFDFEARRSVAVKGKGAMTTYLLVGAKAALSPTRSDATFDTLVGDRDDPWWHC
jgi:hypothetical protein